jgi:hypothetical protein
MDQASSATTAKTANAPNRMTVPISSTFGARLGLIKSRAVSAAQTTAAALPLDARLKGTMRSLPEDVDCRRGPGCRSRCDADRRRHLTAILE